TAVSALKVLAVPTVLKVLVLAEPVVPRVPGPPTRARAPSARLHLHRRFQRGSANATTPAPDGAPFLPPPQTITTYSRPSIAYTGGGGWRAAGIAVPHSGRRVAAW